MKKKIVIFLIFSLLFLSSVSYGQWSSKKDLVTESVLAESLATKATHANVSDSVGNAMQTDAFDDSMKNYIHEGTGRDSSVAYFPFDYEAEDYSQDYLRTSEESNSGTISSYTNITTKFDSVMIGVGACMLNGTGYVEVDTVAIKLANTHYATLSLWLNVADATPSATSALVSFGDTDGNEIIELCLDSNGAIELVVIDGGTTQLDIKTANTTVSDNVPVNIIITQNGTIPSFYIDGVLQTDTTISITTDLASWFYECTGIDNGRIGSANYGGAGEASYLTGIVDEVIIEKRAWTNSEVIEYFYTSYIYSLQRTKMPMFLQASLDTVGMRPGEMRWASDSLWFKGANKAFNLSRDNY